MIGYAMLGSNDMDKARTFYDAVLGEIGAKRMMEFPQGATAYGADPAQPMLAITPPYDGEAASVGNGTMIALAAPSRAAVDAVHSKAMELGGADEGEPGVRGDEGPQAFYGAYFRDPDGNKLCAFKIGPAD